MYYNLILKNLMERKRGNHEKLKAEDDKRSLGQNITGILGDIKAIAVKRCCNVSHEVLIILALNR